MRATLLLNCVLSALLVTACGDGVKLRIVSPQEDEKITNTIQYRVNVIIDNGKVDRLVLLVNDAPYQSLLINRYDNAPFGVPVALAWSPRLPGRHKLQIVAYSGEQVVGESSVVHVQVIEAPRAPTPTPMPTLVPTPERGELEPLDNATAEATPTSIIPTPTPELVIGRVRSEILNVRAGPGTNYARVRVLKQGEDFTIVGISKDRKWYRVEDGWVAGDYVTVLSGDLNSLPEAQPN